MQRTNTWSTPAKTKDPSRQPRVSDRYFLDTRVGFLDTLVRFSEVPRFTHLRPRYAAPVLMPNSERGLQPMNIWSTRRRLRRRPPCRCATTCKSCCGHLSVRLRSGEEVLPPHHPRFFDEQLSTAVGTIDYVRGSGNLLVTSIPLYIHGIDFCDCPESTLGWIAVE